MPIHPQPDPGWLSILASQLSAKATNQFRRALRTTSCQLFDDIILPNIFVPAVHSIAVSERKVSPRDHYRSWWWNECVRQGHADLVAPSEQMLFTNALWPCTEQQDEVLYHSPSRRVCFGGSQVFTFEFDQKDLGFFEQQCAWMRTKAKKDTDCAMGNVYRALSRYADFCGLTVVWSGNKSFHIHVVFDPALMLAQTPSLLNCYPRSGFISHWQILKDMVVPILAPTLGGDIVEPDPALKNPDTYRRLPLGTRQHDGQNFFEFPVGTQVPQLVMWEKFRKQAAADAAALFFSAPLFTAAQAQVKAASNRQRSITVAKALPSTFTNDELEYFAAKIRETFPDGSYPEFVRFEHGWSDGWKAMFRNHAGDNTPTSVMKEQYGGVHISGSNPLHLPHGSPRLEQSLGESFAQWRRDIRAPAPSMFDEGDPDDDSDHDAPVVTTTHLLGEGHATGPSEIEQRFAQEARSRETTAKATRRFFREALMNSCVWVKGPEGSGKTTQLMTMTSRRLDASGRMGRSRKAMFAFGDYVSAEEKCGAFNTMQEEMGTSYRGMVIPSFSKLYEMALAALGMPGAKIDNVGAAQKGCASVWSAIEKHQPEVLRWMADHHEKTYRTIDGRWPVFFTVHAVAEQWKSCTYSRLMWGRNFWHHIDNKVEPKDRDRMAREDTHLALMVHDEIDVAKVVAIEPAAVVEWVRNLVLGEPQIWDPASTCLAETYASFTRFSASNPFPPMGDDKIHPFEKVREIFHLGIEQWQDLILNEDGAYEEANPERSIYRNCVVDGHKWAAKPLMWWRGSFGRPVADTLVVLTTEMLPTVAIERADPEGFTVFNLETPLIGRDTVDVHLARSVTSAKMGETCTEFQKKLSPQNPAAIMVISDCVKGRITDSRSHMSARGSNSYIGRHILQTMSFMHPEQHEVLLALNAYTARNDCTALYHLDRFNQTAGRNIGFRKQGGATHTPVINPRLYDFLLRNHGWFFTRYDLIVHLDKRQREHLRTKPVVAVSPTTMALSYHPATAQKIIIGGWDDEPIIVPDEAMMLEIDAAGSQPDMLTSWFAKALRQKVRQRANER